MKRGLLVLLCLGLIAGLNAGSWLSAGAEEEVKAKLIGTSKCNVCHKSEKRGNQAAVWEASAHAKAYETLASDASMAIAKEMGIEDPQAAAECLVCHTTQGFLGEVELDPKGKYAVEEGVGCEACHGAGSEYKSNKVMQDPELSKAAGLITPDEEQCLKCHNEKSPTYQEFVFKERWAAIAHPKAAAE